MDKQNRNVEIYYGEQSLKTLLEEILKKEFIEKII